MDEPHVAEWRRRAWLRLSDAGDAREKAAAQLEQSRLSRDEAVRSGVRSNNELRESLESKVSASQRLVSALQRRVGSIAATMDACIQSLRQLHAAVQSKEAPMQLCIWRLEERAKRPPGESIGDAVEVALEAQRGHLDDVQRRLVDAIRNTAEALDGLERTSRQVQHVVDQTQHALQVDETCLRSTMRAQLEKATPEPPPSAHPPPRRRSPKTGVSMKVASRNEEARADEAARLDISACAEEKALVALRDRNTQLIKQCDSLTKAAAERVVKALQARVRDYQAVRTRLMSSLQETEEQIARAKTEVSHASGEIRALKDPMDMVAVFHLDRQGRAPRENIQDPVTSQMHAHELFVLRSNHHLRRQRDGNLASLQELQRRHAQMLDDLKDKTAAHRIDVACLTHDFGVYHVSSCKAGATDAVVDTLKNLEKRLVPSRPAAACRKVQSAKLGGRGARDCRPGTAR